MITDKVFVVGILILLTIVGLQAHHAGRLADTIKQQDAINKELRDSVTSYRNKHGEVVAQKAAVEADLRLLQTTYSEEFKWIRQHLGVQEKAVKGIFKAVTNTTFQGVGTIDTVVVDASGGITRVGISDSSPWHKFRADISLSPYSVTYDFASWDSVTLVPYYKGKDLYVKGISANPHSKITGLQGILVSKAQKKKPWGIGPSIQIGYDNGVRITPGISIQYSLIRF